MKVGGNVANIDSLEIQIQSSTTKANESIDKLIRRLDTLSNSLKGINTSGLTGLANSVKRLGSAMQEMSSVKTTDFNRLAKNVERFQTLNTSALNNAASSMSHLTRAFNNLGGVSQNAQQVGEMAKNLSKLGNQGVQNAVTNIPQLAAAMRNLMQTLSTAPQVSQNVIQMTQAMTNLAAQSGKVKTESGGMHGTITTLSSTFEKFHVNLKNVSDRITNFGDDVQKTEKKTKTFASAVGMLYAKFCLLARGLKGLWGSIKSSMDYIEVLNYFDAAFGQVAGKAVSQWKEAGYQSAEAYYDSFSKRAKQLTAKMSGFHITDKGTLEATKMPSLGIDPSQVMNYQAMFAQMSSSMGVASETSLKLSQALTQIGADLASVKNMDFDKVWKDMASGLAGMSRTLDKYGVNIRNVNLQQKLTDLGIAANIQSLNQNDKALLRSIILLENTKYAWGDLAETINQPANQLRLLQANFANLARMIGNLFLPIVAKVLPYINALVIAVQRLFTWIGKVLGLDISNISSSVGSGGDQIGDIAGDVGDLEDGLDEADKSAKKLKNNLLGIDELNIISEDTDNSVGNIKGPSIGGLLDDAFYKALEEYQKAWDKAFSNMENRANDLADRIVAFAKYAFEPIRKAWETEGDFVTKSWENALTNVKDLVSSIGKDMMTVWQQDATVKVLEDIFHIFGDIGQIIANIADKLEYAWSKNSTGLHILENIRDIFGAIIRNIRKAADYTVDWSSKLNFSPLLEAFESFTRSIARKMEDISGIFTDFYQTVILGLSKWTLEEGLPKLLGVLQGFVDKVDWARLRSNLQDLWEALERFGETIGEGLIIFIGRCSDALADFVNSPAFENFLKMLENWMDSVDAEDVANALELILKSILAFKAVTLVSGALSTFFDILDKLLSRKKRLKELLDLFKKVPSIGEGAAGEVAAESAVGGGLFSNIAGIATKIAGIVAIVGGAVTAVKNFFDMLKDGFSWADEALMLLGIGITAVGAILLGAPALVTGVIAAIVAVVATLVVVIKEHWVEIKEFFANLWESIKETAVNAWNGLTEFFTNVWNGIKETAASIWESIRDTVTNIWNGVTEAAMTVWNGIRDFLSNIWSGISATAIEIWENIKEFLGNTWDNIKAYASEKFEAIKSAISTAWEGVKNFTFEVWENIKSTVSEIWNGIKETASTVFNAMKEAITNIWEGIKTTSENIWNGIKETVSEIWNGIKEAATFVFEGIGQTVSKAWEFAKTTSLNIWNGIKEFVSNIWNNLLTTASEKFDRIKISIGDTWEKVKNTTSAIWEEVSGFLGRKIPEIVGNVIDTLSKLPGEVYNIGKNLIEGFIKGIGDFAEKAWEAIKNFARGAIDTFKNMLDIHSPSRVFADMGVNTVQGYVNGINSKSDDVSTCMTDIAAKSKKAFNGIDTEFNSIGSNIGSELDSGINSKIYAVEDRVRIMMNMIQNAAIVGLNGFTSMISDAMNRVTEAIQIMLNQLASASNQVNSTRLSYEVGSYSLPAYATGGFPEDGLFFANSTELVGRFSNGQTAVANNEQIIAGIEEAAYRGFARANAENNKQEALLQELIEAVKQGRQISIDGRELVTAYDKRKSRNGYAF